jgi:hypothetical protein
MVIGPIRLKTAEPVDQMSAVSSMSKLRPRFKRKGVIETSFMMMNGRFRGRFNQSDRSAPARPTGHKDVTPADGTLLPIAHRPDGRTGRTLPTGLAAAKHNC